MSIATWLRQRAYRLEHRRAEVAPGDFRLIRLTDDWLPSYIGRRSWCDARLQECPVPGHRLCCYCTHSDKDPRSGGSQP